MAKPPHTGGEMGVFYLICWRRNYPQATGTRPSRVSALRTGWHRSCPAPAHTQQHLRMTRRHGAAEELRSRRALPPQTCPVRLMVGGVTATATVTYDKFPTPVAHHATTMGTGAWPMATNVDSPDDRRHERDGPGDHHDTGPAGHPCPRRRSPCGARRRRRRAVSPFPATVSAARRPASRSPVPHHCVGGGGTGSRAPFLSSGVRGVAAG